MTSSPTPVVPATSRRTWLGLVALLLPVLLASMDLSILYLAMPAIGAALEPSAGQALWIIDVYGFLLAGLLITMGNIGDRIGRRRLLLIGAVVFGVGSVVAALSQSADALIAARALMGVGGATLMPSTLSLIRSMFDDARHRATAIAIWTGTFAGGSALGPVVGGVLLEHFAWGSVFLINVPVLAILLIATPLVVPEYRHPRPSRLDLSSVVLSLAAILPIVWALKHAAENVAADTGSVLAAVVGMIAAVAFVRRQRRLDEPLLDISLFSSHRFSGAVVAGSVSMFAMTGVLLFATQHLQLVAGHGPLVAAAWTLPALAAVAIGSVSAPAIAQRIGRPAVFGAAFALAAAGLAVLAFVPADGSLGVLLAGLVLMGAGVSPALALATDIVVTAAPPDRAGAASAVSETGNELGAALGIAIMGSVGAAVYRSTVAAELPSEVPAELAAAAATTLPAAVDVASALPPGLAEPVLVAARSAFVDGMGIAALVGAVLLAVLAMTVPRLLRRGDEADGP